MSRFPQELLPETTHLHVQGVTKQYAGLTALQGIDLHIRRGEIFGIIGRSGAGKSSLLRLLNRLENPSQGQVLVEGLDIAGLQGPSLRELRRKVAMIFQHFNLMSTRTVAQNIELPLRMAGVPRAERAKRVAALLELVGLGERAGAYPAQLSGGQKQRVGIARALVLEPHILLCDEATSALDPQSTQAILELLRDINRRLGLTIVLITHEMAVIREICDRVVVLEKGAVVEQGDVWQVFGDPQHEVTRTLLGTRQPLPEASEAHDLLLELHYTGARPLPDLVAIAAALGSQVRLRHASLECIQGRTLGHLGIAVDTHDHTGETLLARARQVADRVTCLGLPPS